MTDRAFYALTLLAVAAIAAVALVLLPWTLSQP